MNYIKMAVDALIPKDQREMVANQLLTFVAAIPDLFESIKTSFQNTNRIVEQNDIIIAQNNELLARVSGVAVAVAEVIDEPVENLLPSPDLPIENPSSESEADDLDDEKDED